MRSGSTTFRSAGVAAVLAMAAPCTAALADDSAQVGIAPPRPAPGGGVSTPVPGGHARTATVTSAALLADAEAAGGTGPAHETPVAPVRAGGGSTAASAAADGPAHRKDTGPGRKHTVVGLVLAGAAAVAVAVRSSRRRRRTGAE
jgi:hypothetical protein